MCGKQSFSHRSACWQIDPCDLTWSFPLVGSTAWRLLESFMSDSYLNPPFPPLPRGRRKAKKKWGIEQWVRGRIHYKWKMTAGDRENVKEEEGCIQQNKSGHGCWGWAPAANVASLMWLAHCAKLHKPSSSPWTAHLKVNALDQLPDLPPNPPDLHKCIFIPLIEPRRQHDVHFEVHFSWHC